MSWYSASALLGEYICEGAGTVLGPDEVISQVLPASHGALAPEASLAASWRLESGILGQDRKMASTGLPQGFPQDPRNPAPAPRIPDSGVLARILGSWEPPLGVPGRPEKHVIFRQGAKALLKPPG